MTLLALRLWPSPAPCSISSARRQRDGGVMAGSSALVWLNFASTILVAYRIPQIDYQAVM